MAWNYRIVKTEKGYGIFEVYYGTEGEPCGMTAEPIVGIYSDTPKELLLEIELIKNSLDQNPEILMENQIGGGLQRRDDKIPCDTKSTIGYTQNQFPNL